MASGIEKFRESIPVVREQLGDLKEKLQSVLGVINEGKLVPDAMAESVAESLRICREKESELRSVASELNFSVEDCSFDRMAELADEAEKELSLSGLREIVCDYFRLTTTAQDTLQALEDSKKELQKVCRLIGDQFAIEFEPYSKVVEHVRVQEDVGSDYDLILDKLGKGIVRAADKVQLEIDAEADISGWMDESADLLKLPGTDEVVSVVEEKSGEEELAAEDVSSGSEADEEVVAAEDGVILENIPGCVMGPNGLVIVSIEKDAPVSDAHASKFISKARDPKHVGALIFTLNVLMRIQLYPVDKANLTAKMHGLFPAADLQYLENQGYVGIVAFEQEGIIQRYYAPTSKTYSCMKRPAVASFMKDKLSRAGSFFAFPAFEDLVPLKDWSPEFAYRCKMLVDYFFAADVDYPFVVNRTMPNSNYAVGVFADKEDGADSYVPCLLKDDVQSLAVDLVKSSVKEGKTPSFRWILVLVDRKDLEKKAGFFDAEDPMQKEWIRFACVSDPKNLYDLNGHVIPEEENPTVDTEMAEEQKEMEPSVSSPASDSEDKVPSEATARDASDGDSSEDPFLHPIKPIPKLKDPSNARFDDVLSTTNKLFGFLHDNLTFLGLLDESYVISEMETRDYSADKTIELLNYLENKGYLCTYEYKGRNIICFTELMWSCLNKASLQNLIRRRFKNIEEVKQCNIYGGNDMEKAFFVWHLAQVDLYIPFINQLRTNSAFTDLLPSTRWNDEEDVYKLEYPYTNPDTGASEESYLVLMSHEDYVSKEVQPGDALICYSKELPMLENIEAKAFYMCLTDEGLYFINDDNEWEALAESKPQEEEKSDGRSKTPVIPENAKDTLLTEEEDLPSEKELLSQSNVKVVDAENHTVMEDIKKEEPAEDESEELYLDDLVVPEKVDEETEIDENLSAAETAQKILETIGGGYPSDNDMVSLIRKLLAEGVRDHSVEHHLDQVFEALALSKLLSFDKHFPVCADVFYQLQAALPLYRGAQGLNGLYLVNVFINETPMTSAAKICAYIYGMLFPAGAHDYVFSDLYSTAFDEFETHFTDFGALKNLYHKAMKVLEKVPSGFSPANLVALADSKEQMERMNSIAKEARELLPCPSFSSSIKGMRELYELSFGAQSDLRAVLDVVCANDISLRELAENAYLQFCDEEGELDDDKFEKFVDDQWNEAHSRFKHTMALKYDARKHVLTALKERILVIKEWLDETETAAGPDVEKLRSFRTEILQEMDEAIPEILAMEELDQRNLILAALDNIRNKLQNHISSENSFTTLLRSGYFILGNEDAIINTELNSIRFAEPWRNMLRHIACTDYDLKDVYNKILNADTGSFLYDNYFQLEKIGKLIGAKAEEYMLKPEMQKKAIASANLEARNFKEKLEISYAYNRINENERERLAALADPEISDVCRFFYEHNAFGRWRSFLDALKLQIREASLQRSWEIKRSLDQARTMLKEGESSELLDEAEKLALEKQNFAVAEDYINRFNNQERKIPFDASDGVKNYYLDFISDGVFTNLYSYCEKRKDSTMPKIGAAYLESNRPESWTVRHFDDARQLLQKWPTGANAVDNVPSFFAALGLDVEIPKCNKYKRGKDVCFTLSLRRTEKNKTDYRHPIALFGTQLPRQMEVLCLFGKRTANQLIDDACKLEFQHFFIVLLDSTLALAERRRMAEYFFTHKNVGQASFLVIDRLLALYLALQPDSERIPALLQCALPYTIYQPFTAGSGSVYDEMFFGRVSELASIRDMSGTSIVYGGRQLGKSALLERVEHLENKPEKREYVVRTSIVGLRGEKTFVENLIAACNNVFDGFSVKPCETVSDFISQIETLIKTDRIAVLRLLIDESDDFLDSISANNYRELRPMIQFQRNSDKRFKFVFAGLHNVFRAKNATKDNGDLGQLSAAVCVKPLNPMDARNLLVRPLKYLGFRITNESQIDTILTNTNYYPGIIQYFGYKLVQTLASQYTQKYNAAKGNPPFELHDDQLADIMNSENLNEEIKKRLRMTLEMDERYYMLARCITMLYHWNNSDHSAISVGFDAKSIREIVELYEIHCLEGLDEVQTIALLDEMEEMGILSKPNAKEKKYLLRRRTFIDTIGPKEDALERDIEENNKVVNLS